MRSVDDAEDGLDGSASARHQLRVDASLASADVVRSSRRLLSECVRRQLQLLQSAPTSPAGARAAGVDVIRGGAPTARVGRR